MAAIAFEFEAQYPVEMKSLGVEPRFELFAAAGVEFDEHFTFVQIRQDPPGRGSSRAEEALGQFLGTLPGEAGEGVLGKETSHLCTYLVRMCGRTSQHNAYTESGEKANG